MKKLSILFTFLLSVLVTAKEGDTRTWTDSSGDRTFVGTFISADDKVVVVKKQGGKEYNFPLDWLNQKDRNWVYKRIRESKYGAGVFDSLNLGDSHELVTDKLKECKILKRESENGGIISTKTPFQGAYKTKDTIGGLHFRLYLAMSQGQLGRIELRSDSISPVEYDTRLASAWSEAAELFSSLYGKAEIAQGRMPTVGEVRGITNTHKWDLEEDGVVVLGIAPSVDKKGEYIVNLIIAK